jgi:hypothetical protein
MHLVWRTGYLTTRRGMPGELLRFCYIYFTPFLIVSSSDRMPEGKFLFGYSGTLLHCPLQVGDDFLARNRVQL